MCRKLGDRLVLEQFLGRQRFRQTLLDEHDQPDGHDGIEPHGRQRRARVEFVELEQLADDRNEIAFQFVAARGGVGRSQIGRKLGDRLVLEQFLGRQRFRQTLLDEHDQPDGHDGIEPHGRQRRARVELVELEQLPDDRDEIAFQAFILASARWRRRLTIRSCGNRLATGSARKQSAHEIEMLHDPVAVAVHGQDIRDGLGHDIAQGAHAGVRIHELVTERLEPRVDGFGDVFVPFPARPADGVAAPAPASGRDLAIAPVGEGILECACVGIVRSPGKTQRGERGEGDDKIEVQFGGGQVQIDAAHHFGRDHRGKILPALVVDVGVVVRGDQIDDAVQASVAADDVGYQRLRLREVRYVAWDIDQAVGAACLACQRVNAILDDAGER